MSTTVIEIISIFASKNISAVPIIDENGVVLNLYDTVDIMVSVAVSCKEREYILMELSFGIESGEVRKI